MKFNKKDLMSIPNLLTYVRFLCVPFFVWIILDKSIENNVMIAFGIFMCASATDMLDGYIARRFNMISDIGKLIDPAADKLLQVSTLLCLTLIGKINLVFPLLFFIKESALMLSGCYIINVLKSDYEMQANLFGKASTMLNSLGIVLSFFIGQVNIAYDISAQVVLGIGLMFTLNSSLCIEKLN